MTMYNKADLKYFLTIKSFIIPLDYALDNHLNFKLNSLL